MDELKEDLKKLKQEIEAKKKEKKQLEFGSKNKKEDNNKDNKKL